MAFSTWDPATVALVTLSGGNLIATNTGTTAAEQGAKGSAADGKTDGKYYFEATFTAYTGGISRTTVGVGPAASTYTATGSASTAGAIVVVTGAIHANGVGSIADLIVGNLPVGTTVGIAVDLDNRRAWFRQAPSGLWNNSATTNPATNTEGVTVPAGTMVPYCTFGGTAGTAGNITTANFGASAFVGAVPAGFGVGWGQPAAPVEPPVEPPPQLFVGTPAGAGRGRMIRRRERKREDEDLVPPPLSPSPPDLQPPAPGPQPPDLKPPAPGLMAGIPIPLARLPDNIPLDEDEEEIALLLELLS